MKLSQDITLSKWLVYLESLHPSEIDLGLDRNLKVSEKLDIDLSDKKIITVAGTNGKGSCICLLNNILLAAGFKTGAYTSPHISRYNERVSINNHLATDRELCNAFIEIEKVRSLAGIQLTYFEFGTLAALLLFSNQEIDYVLLEVGLGGRLDAVNIIDADVSILTNIALDHTDWLGDTRESIGFEKAGIFRSGKPAILGDLDMPDSVLQQAARIGSDLFSLGKEFQGNWTDGQSKWHWVGVNPEGKTVSFQGLPHSGFALNNLAAVVQALMLTIDDLAETEISQGISNATLPGRFQQIQKNYTLILDVAHNPHAAVNLKRNLLRHFPDRQYRIMVAMLKDKDSFQFLKELKGLDAKWYVGEIEHDRGSEAKILYNQLLEHGESSVMCFDTVEQAFKAADADAQSEDVVLITGSFYTVSAVSQLV